MLQMDLKWRAIAAGGSLLLALILTFIPGVGLGFSFIFWLIFLVFLTGYFLLGTLSSAAKVLNAGDVDSAERILNYTIRPNWLLKVNRGYFYMIKGTIALQRNQTDEGETAFEKALEIGIATENDRAMVLLNLANINYSKRKFQQATSQLQILKKMNISEVLIVEKIKELDQALKVKPSGMANMMYGAKMGQRMLRLPQQPTTTSSGNNRKQTKARKKRK